MLKEIELNLKYPSDLEPLPFQRGGVFEILSRNNVLLGDEMGLGKTIQLILSMNYARLNGDLNNVLICCPKSLLWNFYFEIAKWSEGIVDWELDESLTVGTDSFLDLDRPLLIVSYETMSRNAKLLGEKKWDWLIFDEFHYLKNSGTKRAKGTKEFLDSQIVRNEQKEIVKQPKIIGATGSPIVNFIAELYPLIHILDPVAWWSQARFDREFVVRSRSGVKAYGRNQARLQTYLREGVGGRIGIMIRRTKKEVLPELPKKRRQSIEFPSEGLEQLLQEQMNIFQGKDRKSEAERLVDELLEINSSGLTEGEMDWDSVITNMKYDRQYFFTEMARVRHLVAQAKLPQVLEHISDVLESFENGEKLVIIAHHRDILESINTFVNKWYLDNHGLNGASKLIMGGMNDREKHNIINVEFQTTDLPRVIVGGIKVVGHGFTMTRSQHLIFAEADWVPSTIQQMEDRLHRIGQELPILIQHLTLKNSLDALMAKKVINKLRQMDKVLNRPTEATNVA